MNLQGRTLALFLTLLATTAGTVRAQKGPALSDAEQDKLRDAQDPGERIIVYLDLSQARLDRFETFRQKPVDPQYDTGDYLDRVLGDYMDVNEELKNWIDYQYRRDGDMRRGLRVLLERGPQQLATLRHIQQSPDPYAAAYRDSLADAIDQVSDLLDGATRALADQEKKFGELKREEKAEAQKAKERAKEEKKRTKEEEKLRKQMHKGKVPVDSQEED